MEEDSDAGAVPRDASEGDGGAVFEPAHELEGSGHVRVRVLRAGAVQLEGEVRFGDGVAEFLGSRLEVARPRGGRQESAGGARRSPVRALRRAPRTRLR